MIDKKFLDEFSPLIREYAAYKLTIQGCSEKTVNEYLLDLRIFCRYLIAEEENIDKSGEEFNKIDITRADAPFFERVTTGQIYEFLYYADKERGNLNRAKARKLSALKSFYKYLTVKKKLFENNPAITIETPKMKKQLPKHLTLEESISLLNAVRTDGESRTKERDYAILTLFLNCGMRLSELVGISLPDLDPDLRSLRVLGKGAKERMIYLNDACRDALNVYLPIRRATLTKGDNALFLSSRSQRISVKTVQWMVYKYLKAAGLENRKFSTHKLRHTAATLMYQSGNVDIRVLKDILGHEQLNTTQIYTHISNESMESAMQSNPLADIKAPKHIPSAETDNESDET